MTALKMIKQASLVVSAGMLFTACATHKEETNEYSSSYSTGSTMSEQSGSQATYSSQTSQSQQSSGSYSSSAQSTSGENEIVIPLHEEQFNVGKKSVPAGQVTIKKIVTTETVNQPIELRRERIIIEREGAGAAVSGQASSQSSGNASGASAQAGVSAGSSGASVSAGAGGAGVSASAQAPSVQTSTTTTQTTSHDKTRTVGAQLNQRAANSDRTVAGNEPVGTKGSDYNSITGVPRSEDEQTTTTSTTTSATLPEDKSLQAGARVSESAGAQPGYQSNQSSYQSSSSTQSSSAAGTSPQSGAAFQEQTYTIQLNEEQPVIEKSVKQTGRVVARKSAEWEKQTVQRELRREDVQVDKGNGLNVELRGDFSEAAGAQSSQGTQSSQETQRSNTQSQQQQLNYEYEQQRQQHPVTAPSTIDRQRREPTTRGGAEDLLQDPD